MTLSCRADEDEDFDGMCEVVISVKMKMELKYSFIYCIIVITENYGKLNCHSHYDSLISQELKLV